MIVGFRSSKQQTPCSVTYQTDHVLFMAVAEKANFNPEMTVAGVLVVDTSECERAIKITDNLFFVLYEFLLPSYLIFSDLHCLALFSELIVLHQSNVCAQSSSVLATQK